MSPKVILKLYIGYPQKVYIYDTKNRVDRNSDLYIMHVRLKEGDF